MSLIKCTECGAEIAKSAKICPHCGHKKGNLLRKSFKIIGGLLVLIIVLGTIANGDKKRAVKPTVAVKDQPAIETNVIRLIDDYEANEIAADEKYKGKRVKLSGTVRDIKKDIGDNLYVIFNKGGRFDFRGIQLFFDDSYTSSLAKLKKGQRISVNCRVKGLMMNVILKDCQ